MVVMMRTVWRLCANKFKFKVLIAKEDDGLECISYSDLDTTKKDG